MCTANVKQKRNPSHQVVVKIVISFAVRQANVVG